MDNQQLAMALCAIAREAGAAIMAIYRDPKTVQVQDKDDRSPLTNADRAANAVICRALEGLSERWPIISEENKNADAEVRTAYQRCWMVDPLDGTKEFIKRNGEFTVNIALIDQGHPLIGVVYAPDLDQLYWSVPGVGAFMQLPGGTSTAIRAATFSRSDKHLAVVCSRSHLNAETQAFIDDLDQPQTVESGSSLKFMLLARGAAHLYPRLAPTMEWDTAAAQAILEAAGGSVRRLDGEPLRYNKRELLNPHFVAAGAQRN
ncbi:MAG: 3'(2'),5'-bisphosphate nucleotidase CysQ [Deltaproteobacteria bacterium]|nr:3'(2'),5'-bisphosphate nucleotidase CysQ [Deltaproteobacteria bacterium]